MTADRICPICESQFTPKRVDAVACSPSCTKKAKKLRAALRDSNAGKRTLKPDRLALALKVLEADEVITAAKAQRKPAKVPSKTFTVLDDEIEDEAEDRRWRNAYAAERALWKRWMRDWRMARYRMVLRMIENDDRPLPMWVTERFIAQAREAYPDGPPPL